MNKNVGLIRDFFSDLETMQIDVILGRFTEDAVYHNMPVPTDPTTGHEWIRAKLVPLFDACNRLEVKLISMIGEGDKVLVERVEIWHFKSGEKATLPVMGAFDMKGDRIAAWREYWDMASLLPQLPEEFIATAAAALEEQAS